MAVETLRKNPSSLLDRLTKNSEAFVAFAAVLVVGMMVIPLPGFILDLLLVLNITFALMILLVTMYTTEPLQFSSFPSILLMATLFRLSLNISATRLILLQAHAGSLISAFGNFVVGGNYVVGLVVFLLLVIIQFVVITNGSGRVAEVAARFTLDAMPGKQMAIDADLNAGIITEEQARIRRQNISKEADFYGAMDGASKFVRGDAIAAIIMIIVNILGGFVVGVAQKHMDIMGALQTYTLLTVGEGLVTQIPALLVSTSTGLVVTRTSSESNLGQDIAGQLFAQPRALMIAGIVIFLLGMAPGLPKGPFLLVGSVLAFISYSLMQNVHAGKKKPASEQEPPKPKQPESMTQLLTVDTLEVEIGYGLIVLADPKQGGEMLERITLLRRQIASDLGIIVPAVRVRDNVQLRPNVYSIKLKDVEIAKGEIFPGQSLAMDAGSATSKIAGTPTTEPTFGLPATWIPEANRTEAEIAGYTVVDPLTVLITHLGEVIRGHAAEIISRQDMQGLIDNIKSHSPAVVDELIPNIMTVGEVQKVIQNLLEERVSVRDLASILETIADHAKATKDPDTLAEYVRQSMGRGLCNQYLHADGVLHAFTLDPKLEQMIADSVRQTEMGGFAVLAPDVTTRILKSVSKQIDQMSNMGYAPVCICSPRVRLYFHRMTEQSFSQLGVLSYAEITPEIHAESTGMVILE